MFATILLAVTLGPLPGQAASSTNRIDLIADTGIERGLLCQRDDGQWVTQRAFAAATEPVWRLRPHHSRSRLAESRITRLAGGSWRLADEFASVRVERDEGVAHLVMELDAFQEYEGRYRSAGDPWPHLFLAQRISEPGGHLGARSPTLAEIGRLDFTASVRLIEDQSHCGPGYDSRIHAAQFLCYFTVQNLEPASSGYGDYYWFGITFYDSRHPVTTLSAQRDAGSDRKVGTEKWIYNVGVAPFVKAIVAEGEWVSVTGDLLPHLRAGLEEGWRHGFLANSTDLSQFRIGSVVVGWEITGLNHATVALKDLRAVATLR